MLQNKKKYIYINKNIYYSQMKFVHILFVYIVVSNSIFTKFYNIINTLKMFKPHPIVCIGNIFGTQ